MKKICFVIMGYGKKTDPTLGKTFDLDKTYHNIIKPAVSAAGYECVRGDEVQESGLIDRSMYGLLIHSDLVIADITTFNPNAIYELGIRHAAKPFSTIIMKEKDGNIPFDINHNKTFTYSHMGEDISATEATRCQSELTKLILIVEKSCEVDSPLFQHIQTVQPYILPQEEYMHLIKELAEKEKIIFAQVEQAKHEMSEGNFEEAIKHWKRASEKVENDSYFIQQLALCTYKNKNVSEKIALTDALSIIKTLEPDGRSTNDPETLGITGAIYKRLWLLDNSELEFLERAIRYYERGFTINSDYYTGENYALCLELKIQFTTDTDEKIYCKVQARKTREKIIEIINQLKEDDDFLLRSDLKWIYATLANCYLALGIQDKFEEHEALFLENTTITWEIETYQTSKEKILALKNN
ncbi:tetratricopeptide repeat-containing protein [Chryseobacterium sp. SIMBA_029]|uniref:tetratricopeptide repeat-containing protein n=1 Tax=Chryseobacterium sp. SIMBA_029 TaxID=3085772 RepID=UPI003979AE7A